MINDIARKSINVDAPNNVPVAQIKEYDDFILKLALMKYNTPFDCTGQTATLGVKAPSGLFEQTTDITINKEQIDIKLKTGIISKAGTCAMELKLVDSTGSMTTASFFIVVNRKILNDEAVEASDEFDSLTEAKKMEPIRQENELKRQENEKGRVEAEKLRVQSETNRADAENIREQQELARQTCYKEIEESRMDFDGGIHRNLKLRLKRDFGDIYERFNKAKLLPYEAEYISASNSYKGMTRDNVVKGRTLQNLLNNLNNITHTANSMASSYVERNIIPNAKPNTKYTLILSIFKNSLSETFRIASSDTGVFPPSIIANAGETGTKKILLTSNESIVGNQFIFGTNKGSGEITFTAILLEGDYTNKPIPNYFEGIKSVNEDGENLEQVSCGKNLIDIIKIGKFIGDDTFEINLNGDLFEKGIFTNRSTDKITISYDAKLGTATNFRCDLVYGRNSYTSTTGITQGTTFEHRTATSDGRTVSKIRFNWSTIGTVFIKNLQIEISPAETEYEKYTEDRQVIKMKNLRSVGNVCDTSDGVRRIGKVIFSGGIDEKWEQGSNNTLGTTRYSLKVNNVKRKGALVCDNICVGNTYTTNDVIEINDVGAFVICKQFGSLDLFKAWLKANPVTIYYELATPTTEEGNIEELRTYDGVTNIFTEGSLIEPTISCKVPSNVQAVVMNLREENQALNNDVNTLQATTEENNLMNIETNVNQEARLTMLELGVI